MNEVWTCPDCMQTICGSLAVVLILASTHRCKAQTLLHGQTVCLDCGKSPTGLCVYHTQCLLAQSDGAGSDRTFYPSF
ncbi:MAG: hypothetical protein HZB51_22895 [Chloroflexi bacterium]|nr:hypothetical protein [Chloroflexota bacterium]